MHLAPYTAQARFLANKFTEKQEKQNGKKRTKHAEEIDNICDGFTNVLRNRPFVRESEVDEECRQFIYTLDESVCDKKLSSSTRRFLKSIGIGE